MRQPLKPDQIVHRLRLMAESGGNISRDRRNVIIEAADMIEEMEERICIMQEGNNLPGGNIHFNFGGGDS